MQNSGRQTGDLSTVLVANEKNLVALATVLVAISSPAAVHFTTIPCKPITWAHWAYIERYGLTAVVPILTALIFLSLNDLQFFFEF